MKKTLTIMLAAAMAITMTAAFTGCNNDKTGASAATSASATANATQKSTAKASEKPTAKATQKPTQAPTEAPTEEETEAPTEAPTQESTFNVSEIIKEDEFTTDDARDALLQFLGGGLHAHLAQAVEEFHRHRGHAEHQTVGLVAEHVEDGHGRNRHD